jgi:uncharacterized protein (DUF4415 family)
MSRRADYKVTHECESKREQAAALDKRKTEELKSLLADESVLTKLRATHWTHPDRINSSLLWCGASGRAKWLRQIKQALAGQPIN